MGREISLDGAETSVIKSLGIGSGDTEGSVLVERCGDMDFSELCDTLQGLVQVGFVDADSDSFHDRKKFERVHFRVNSGYAKELKEALDPTPQAKQSKRVRRE